MYFCIIQVFLTKKYGQRCVFLFVSFVCFLPCLFLLSIFILSLNACGEYVFLSSIVGCSSSNVYCDSLCMHFIFLLFSFFIVVVIYLLYLNLFFCFFDGVV